MFGFIYHIISCIHSFTFHYFALWVVFFFALIFSCDSWWFAQIFSFNKLLILHFSKTSLGFPGGAVVKNPPANAGDTGSIPGPAPAHLNREGLRIATKTQRSEKINK